MERYLLFAGRHAHPKGGWGDYLQTYSNAIPAMLDGERLPPTRYDWWHVVDIEQGEVIAEGTTEPRPHLFRET